MKYKIISAHSYQALEQFVNDALNEGWYLVGGPIFANGIFYQAVHKPS